MLLWDFKWEAKIKIIFPIFSLKSSYISQFCADFVKNRRNPGGAFNKQITKSVYHDCKKIYWCFESFFLNLTMRETEIFAYIHPCAQSYVTYKSSQFLHLHLFFLDVHIRFSSQCEFTCYWSSFNKQWSDFFAIS